jgi:Na+/melibiose symporter-like transporter
MGMVFKDKQVLSFSGMILFVQLTYQLMLMNVPYLTTLVLGESEAMASVLMGEVILLIAASTPLWYRFLKRFPKRKVMRVIILLMTFGFVMSFFVGKFPVFSPFVQALIIIPLAAIPMGGMFTASVGLIADLSDYGELKDRKRSEAVYYGIYGIVRKLGWAVCSFLLTATFSLFGYTAENPLGVRMIWIICAAATLIGFLLFIPYAVGDSKEETAKIFSFEKK